ncbi:ERG20 [Symbiodinium natans]|uniref:ERG20 protein n=1 Tax=Symbiodinium natans TaxID=878477 RepID=A0A812UG22_9DINO|nr:ERG20 [Symbiodinium natans]
MAIVSAIRLASTACCVAVLAGSSNWLATLPTNVLFGLLTSIATLIALSFIPDNQGQSQSEPHRYPATDWKSALPQTNIRASYPKYDEKEPKKSFESVCECLIQECTASLPSTHELPKMEQKWIVDMLEYNVKGGKMNRGLMVVESGKVIMKSRGQEPTDDDLKKLAVLGWCIEWLQAWLLVADDFMDSSETRRGQVCWYKKEGVDEIAINDAFLLEMLVFRVLKRHFWAEPYYMDLVDLFMETTFQTECGQLLDLQCKNLGLADFTYKRWELIVKYKTAFYSFYLPVALGMTVAGIKNQAAYDAAREPLLLMGVYFQAQDDYLDAFAPPETLGKIGTDIQDKKCGWLFVQAYHELCSPEQKAYLDEHYGKCKVQTEEEKKIKEIYRDIGLEEKYTNYEAQSYKDIMAFQGRVEEVGLPWEIIDIFLKKVYKRSK